jgi:hypothetical protein
MSSINALIKNRLNVIRESVFMLIVVAPNVLSPFKSGDFCKTLKTIFNRHNKTFTKG